MIATRWLPVLSVVLLSALPYLPAVAGGYFLADDFGYVRLFHSAGLRDLLRLFAADWSQGIWDSEPAELRPIIAFSYRLDALLWGINPVGYHATNLLAQVINTGLVFAIATRLLGAAAPTAWLAAVIFAVAPSHTEPVCWIAGRTDLIAASFYLGSFLLFLEVSRARRLASLALFAVGLFAKESVVMLPVLILAYVVCCRPARTRWTTVLPFFAVVLLYFALRAVVFPKAVGAPVEAVEFLQRQRYYLELLLLPMRPLESWTAVNPRLLVPVLKVVLLAFLVGGGVLVWRNRRASPEMFRLLLFAGPIWYAVSVLPLVVTYASARHLYIASAGMAISLALLASMFLELRAAGWRLAALGALGALLLAHGASLAASSVEWARSSGLSRKMHAEVEQLAAALPRGSVILLGQGPSTRTLFWEWALPYALEPPFSRVGVEHAIVMPPRWFCCRNWWDRHRAALQLLLVDDPPPLYVFHWNAERGELLRTAVTREQFRSAYEHAARRAFVPRFVHPDEAVRLVEVLGRQPGTRVD